MRRSGGLGLYTTTTGSSLALLASSPAIENSFRQRLTLPGQLKETILVAAYFEDLAASRLWEFWLAVCDLVYKPRKQHQTIIRLYIETSESLRCSARGSAIQEGPQ